MFHCLIHEKNAIYLKLMNNPFKGRGKWRERGGSYAVKTTGLSKFVVEGELSGKRLTGGDGPFSHNFFFLPLTKEWRQRQREHRCSNRSKSSGCI